jgi:DNA-binding response OmpR family regulator
MVLAPELLVLCCFKLIFAVEYIGMATGSVLLVDDEEIDREKMRRTLGDGVFVIIEADTYQKALAVFELHRASIVLLITDISLPGGNGCELAIALRQQKPDLRVLFVSGYCGAEICRYYSLDVSDEHFLSKPFAAADLKSRVRQILDSSDRYPKKLYTGVERRKQLRR